MKSFSENDITCYVLIHIQICFSCETQNTFDTIRYTCTYTCERVHTFINMKTHPSTRTERRLDAHINRSEDAQSLIHLVINMFLPIPIYKHQKGVMFIKPSLVIPTQINARQVSIQPQTPPFQLPHGDRVLRDLQALTSDVRRLCYCLRSLNRPSLTDPVLRRLPFRLQDLIPHHHFFLFPFRNCMP